ncbi:hypothetical protein JQ582_42270 [Bradyrhizobium japonicum]|uniref:hypothetical protein n=1 Tax=Bradyrhizobium japonicum TaxID=375 RepID=UPI001BA95BC1|nr:hypothetical protein [Bradyrhizobium japonicum]MBR0750524.1 hypothetical protein [Bradyrhizobium japonicum]
MQSQPRLQRLRSIRLLDAGRRLDGLVEEFKAAAARLADATALARTLVPDVPEEIVCDSREWSDCWYDYCDVDGKDFPTETYVDDHGKTKWRPRLKFVDADRLRAFAKENPLRRPDGLRQTREAHDRGCRAIRKRPRGRHRAIRVARSPRGGFFDVSSDRQPCSRGRGD